MKAIILAAGYGKRLGSLTDVTPKPLIEIAGKPLIFYHLEKIASLGIKEVVINVFHLKEKIKEVLGNGEKWNLTIHYSEEVELLETGGGIKNALHLLGPQPFLVVNGDIFTDFPFDHIPSSLGLNSGYLILVENPQHNSQGDFCLNDRGVSLINLQSPKESCYTYSGIAKLHPDLFADEKNKIFRLGDVLRNAVQQQRLSGSFYPGVWFDSGTPERLESIRSFVRSCS
jgi:N-acetyl-alpha-D-muramate 1-phosphate uridylyltransferase